MKHEAQLGRKSRSPRPLSLLCTMLACTALAYPPKGVPKYESDRGTVGFLRRYLVSGGDIHYPSDADRRRLQASGFFVMKLRPDGIVESVTIKSSTGYTVLDEEVTRTLKAYRFKPNTAGPLLWLVSFLQPTTVIVKVLPVDEKNLPPLPK
jgi:TonB family protein